MGILWALAGGGCQTESHPTFRQYQRTVHEILRHITCQKRHVPDNRIFDLDRTFSYPAPNLVRCKGAIPPPHDGSLPPSEPKNFLQIYPKLQFWRGIHPIFINGFQVEHPGANLAVGFLEVQTPKLIICSYLQNYQKEMPVLTQKPKIILDLTPKVRLKPLPDAIFRVSCIDADINTK